MNTISLIFMKNLNKYINNFGRLYRYHYDVFGMQLTVWTQLISWSESYLLGENPFNSSHCIYLIVFCVRSYILFS